VRLLGNPLWTTTGAGSPIPPPTPTPTVVERLSGGYYESGRRRTKEELAADRARFGIAEAAAEIVSNVALRQAEHPGLDDSQQLAELQGEMEARGIRLESEHVSMLETLRARYRLEAIEQQARTAEEQDIVFVMTMLSEIDDLH
jgi:hypothetical protein